MSHALLSLANEVTEYNHAFDVHLVDDQPIGYQYEDSLFLLVTYNADGKRYWFDGGCLVLNTSDNKLDPIPTPVCALGERIISGQLVEIATL